MRATEYIHGTDDNVASIRANHGYDLFKCAFNPLYRTSHNSLSLSPSSLISLQTLKMRNVYINNFFPFAFLLLFGLSFSVWVYLCELVCIFARVDLLWFDHYSSHLHRIAEHKNYASHFLMMTFIAYIYTNIYIYIYVAMKNPWESLCYEIFPTYVNCELNTNLSLAAREYFMEFKRYSNSKGDATEIRYAKRWRHSMGTDHMKPRIFIWIW